jgi:hypothetical protein
MDPGRVECPGSYMLARIAGSTSQCQIPVLIGTTTCKRHNVLDIQRAIEDGFRRQALLAAKVGSCCDEVSEPMGHRRVWRRQEGGSALHLARESPRASGACAPR